MVAASILRATYLIGDRTITNPVQLLADTIPGHSPSQTKDCLGQLSPDIRPPRQCSTCKLMFVTLKGLLLMFNFDITTCQNMALYFTSLWYLISLSILNMNFYRAIKSRQMPA